MKILSRYINKTIIYVILLITLILMGIEILLAFIGELSNIGTGNYGMLAALRFVLLDMPYQLSTLFPMAGLVGSLIGLGLLASQSELIVMQAAGFSTGQISAAVLKAALVIVILATLLGEFVAPYSEDLATSGRAWAKSNGQALTTKQGMWLRESNSFIHISQVLTTHHLLGITSYNFNNENRLVEALSADQGNYRNGEWFLSDVKQTLLTQDKAVSATVPWLRWGVRLDPSLLSIADGDPRNMSILSLYTYINYLKANGLRATNYELSFWKRIIQPLATVVMIFLAVPFVFGPLRTVPMGLRIVTGISVGFCFYILNQFFGPVCALYQIPPIIGAALPTAMFILVGFWLLWRMAKN